ncbi:hypothetical protein HSX37_18750|uniref:Uncharacterized protein n=1 Tax=Dendrosporobacter quercicolus TaxID=146817 RepID=A0A1H0ADX3_9FIRM|nr:hypothetical protein [Dendrosporobacter quercicolus]NSL50052.1 hypothetical protein [Dendrosporobacter quercicolus DSM 1736]SDN31521.1 hypothetical protein SAMN04488502_11742 [Dendrosporobacter quercicolus]
MSDRQIITEPTAISEIVLAQLNSSQNILAALIGASSFQTSNLLRPETVDLVMEAYEKIYCRVSKAVCDNMNCLR